MISFHCHETRTQTIRFEFYRMKTMSHGKYAVSKSFPCLTSKTETSRIHVTSSRPMKMYVLFWRMIISYIDNSISFSRLVPYYFSEKSRQESPAVTSAFHSSEWIFSLPVQLTWAFNCSHLSFISISTFLAAVATIANKFINFLLLFFHLLTKLCPLQYLPKFCLWSFKSGTIYGEWLNSVFTLLLIFFH